MISFHLLPKKFDVQIRYLIIVIQKGYSRASGHANSKIADRTRTIATKLPTLDLPKNEPLVLCDSVRQ